MAVSPAAMLAIACSAALLIHGLSFGSYLADDAAISFAYARNVVKGNGLVLYPGAERVEGYSNPLWVALLAVAAAVTQRAIDPLVILKWLGIALGVLCVLLVVAFERGDEGPGARETQWVAPLLLAFTAPFAFWMIAGLENALYACAILAAVVLYLRELRSPSAWPGWSALALVATALTRPEGAAFILAFLAHRVIVLIAERRARTFAVEWRRAGVWLAVFVAVFGMFLVWRQWYFGAWLPNTYYAKVTDRSLGDLWVYARDWGDPGRRYLVAFLREYAIWLVPLACAGALDVRRWRSGLLLTAVIAGTGLYVLYVGGDWWPGYRFLTGILPLIVLLCARGIDLVVRLVPAGRGRLAVAALLAAGIVVLNLRTTARLWALGDEHLVSVEGRLLQAREVKAWAAAAHIDNPLWLEADIGGPALLGGLRILDLGRLSDVHMARFHYYPPFLRQYVFEEQRPEFIRTHSVWTRNSRVTAFAEFARDYLTIHSRTDRDGLHGLFVRKDLFVSPAAPASEPVARWGALALIGIRLAQRPVGIGQPLTFTWSWRCQPECSTDYVFHVRLTRRGDTAPLVARAYQPVFGSYPTSAWGPDEQVTTTQDLFVPKDVAAGFYDIRVAAAEAGEAPEEFVPVAEVEFAGAALQGRLTTVAPRERHAAEADAAMAEGEAHFAARRYRAAFDSFSRALAFDRARPRARHRLEDARERTDWVAYLYHAGNAGRMLALYREEARAGALPADRDTMEDLYFGLLPVADEALRHSLRAQAGRASPSDTVFRDDSEPVLRLLDSRVEPHMGASRLRLYFEVLRRPARNHELWVHAQPLDASGAPAGTRIVMNQDSTPPASLWRAGEIRVQDRGLYVAPGPYALRAGWWDPDTGKFLCVDAAGVTCHAELGTHTLGR